MINLLADIAEVRMGYSFRSRLEAQPAGHVSVIQMKDAASPTLLNAQSLTRIDLPDLKDRHLVQQGDLLFRSRGGSNSACLVAAALERTVLAAPMLLIRPRAATINPAYLLWFINQPCTQSSLAAQAEGTAVKMISKAALELLSIALPPLLVQHQIVEVARLAEQESALMGSLMHRRKTLTERTLMQRAQADR